MHDKTLHRVHPMFPLPPNHEDNAMIHGYITTLNVLGEDGSVSHSVIDYQDDRAIAERRCENLCAFGKSHGIKFTMQLRREGTPLREWSNA